MGIYQDAAQLDEVKETKLNKLFNNSIFRITAMGIGLVLGVVMGYANILGFEKVFEIASIILVVYLSPLIVLYLAHLWKIDKIRRKKYKEKYKQEKENKKQKDK